MARSLLRRRGLLDVLEEIERHPEIVERKGANAQRLVRDHFTWDRTIEPLDAFCRRPTVRPKPTVPLKVTANKVSESARKQIEAAGGTVTLIAPPERKQTKRSGKPSEYEAKKK